MSIKSRLERVEKQSGAQGVREGCSECIDWGLIAIVERIGDPMPFPPTCPKCGRRWQPAKVLTREAWEAI